ncbi:MAG: SpoIIE family protein phosphatase [Bacteroidota bacterium]|nr:SpoIIE family protein phosphatase [Bacteroidota bacterium]
MNPYQHFKKYIIGDMLLKADDVFEKARIELTFNFTSFFFALGLLFYVNIFANHYMWQFYITTVGVLGFPVVFIILRKTGNIKTAAYFFVCIQIFMSVMNIWLHQFNSSMIGAYWTVVFILFAFFVLGRKWGMIIAGIVITLILGKPIDEALGTHFLNYYIPPEQIPAELPLFVIVPFIIMVYTLFLIVKTRTQAEAHIRKQKILLEKSNKELESKNEDILSSIHYAKRIQQAILPTDDHVQRGIPLSFILYKPRDIVSGDFYWFNETDNDSYIIVAADCTGHGVPGAFMTVIGSNLLDQIVIENKITSPSRIMNQLDDHITQTLKQEKLHYQIVQDGMDLSLIKVNKSSREFIFTSAKRPAVFIRNGVIQELKGSKNSLGGLKGGEKIFEETSINYEEGDMIYLFTDGYTDQFGGSENKKFMIKRLRELLIEIYQLPMNDQKKKLDEAISNWIGTHEQTDDILIMGIRF